MKGFSFFATVIICLQIVFGTVVFSAENELVYIDKDFISDSVEETDITSRLNWNYVGSAANVSKNIISKDNEKYLSLSSDAQKNGGLGGSYYLYSTYYAITGAGSLDFDIRLNSGKIQLSTGDELITSSLYHSAFNLVFDAENNEILCNGSKMDHTFEKSVWYNLQLDFNVVDKTFNIKFSDKDGNFIAGMDNAAFEEDKLFHISNFTFHAADKNPFSMDIKNLSYINKNTQNSGGGYMSISKDNVMQNTYPKTSEETQKLIDNKSNTLRKMEYLTRGLVAIKRMNDVYLSWRWLGTEDISTGYNIYRDGEKINSEPIKESTNYIDTEGTLSSKYVIKSVVDGVEVNADEAKGVNLSNAVTIPLVQYDYENYSSGDGMVGDLDGDGEYEIIVHRYPDDVFKSSNYPLIEAYKLDGTHLWSMNIGPNDLEPKQNPVLIYDLDDDGKSEVVMRIGDDFIDGTGSSVGDMDGDGITNYREYVYSGQYLEKGPEYLAVFDGETGTLIDKTPFEGVIKRDPLISWGNGNAITHRPWKFLFTPLKIDDGTNAFAIGRGIYAKSGIQCWKLINDKLTMVWDFDSNDYFSYTGQGNHNLTSGDVDYDGYDEIIYGGMAIDNDGSPLYTTHLGHGDAIHMSDFDIDRPGLEVMKINESPTAYANCSFFDARTGEVLWGEYAAKDTGRVLCDDLDPRFRGAESYTNGKAFDYQGNVIDSEGGNNFAIYWDSDLLREINDDITISKYMAYDNKSIPLFVADDCHSNNGTKSNCTIQADLYGDWREEFVLPTLDGKSLQVFTTTCPTTYKLYTLMHDPIYRAAVAWQNNQYNQPPHLGFYWGYDVESIPIPQIYTNHNGNVEKSPYTDSNRTYNVTGQKEGFYSDNKTDTVLIDGYPYLNSDISTENSEFSDETKALLGSITAYYDEIVRTGGLSGYVKLPSTKVYLPNMVKFVSDGELAITDINDIPIENLSDEIYYDEENKIISVDEDKSVWIKVKSNSYTQIFNIIGEKYQNKNKFLYDTLDNNPLGSESDFLNGRMNINGWKLQGDRDNVSVITYADSSYSPKKRIVQVKNNSETESVFFLDRPKFSIRGTVTVEFELQLRKGEKDFVNEFILSDSDNYDEMKKSLSIKQIADRLYIGSNGEYKLLASGLELTTGNKSIYKIVANMNFSKKVSDVMLLYSDNVISSKYNVPFYDTNAESIERVMLSTQSGSEIGIDDINIGVYSGVYLISANEEDKVKLEKAVFVNNFGAENATISVGTFDETGICAGVKMFNSDKENYEFDINEIYNKNMNFKSFLWDSIETMKPIL